MSDLLRSSDHLRVLRRALSPDPDRQYSNALHHGRERSRQVGLPWSCPGILTQRHIVLITAVAAFQRRDERALAPAFQTLVPDLVTKDGLATANSINQMSTQTSTLVGQALGGSSTSRGARPCSCWWMGSASRMRSLATWFLPADRPEAQGTTSVRLAFERYAADTRG